MAPSIFLTVRLRPWVLAATLLTLILIGYPRGTALAPGKNGPLGPLSHLRIVVDPGHGGVDAGCNRQDIYEKHINLLVAQALQENLRKMGANVLLTRDADVALVSQGPSRHRRDLETRVQITRDFKADIYLSLHVNAGSPHLGGSLTFFRKGDGESRRLAALIQERLSIVVPGNQNGILPARFLVLTSLSIPTALIEMGFLTHPADRLLLTNPGVQRTLASAIGAGVAAFARGDVPTQPVLSPFLIPEGYEQLDASAIPGCVVDLVPTTTPKDGRR